VAARPWGHRLRTGLSWWDSYRPGWEKWFDRQMEALDEFETTVTFCFTPDHLGPRAAPYQPAQDPMYFADFCARMVERYAPRASAGSCRMSLADPTPHDINVASSASAIAQARSCRALLITRMAAPTSRSG
jgi:hypothetical protein